MKKLNAHFSCRYRKEEFGMIVCYILPCIEFWKDNIGDEDEYWGFLTVLDNSRYLN